MNLSIQLAKHLRDVYNGGNWTCVNMKDTLASVSWEQATTKVYSFNTIATLVHHVHYYVAAQIDVLQGRPLNAKDELSFAYAPINNDADWDSMLSKVFTDVETLAGLIEQLPEAAICQHFTDEKYGTYYRNLQGMIEHTHYHLGQITLIKKIVQETK
ncbi:MAG: DUF1572 domain-containing protein [Bacteroidetes bacterium]|nr:DUF1572 domain-containing protein [Bacteroidota bacterium]